MEEYTTTVAVFNVMKVGTVPLLAQVSIVLPTLFKVLVASRICMYIQFTFEILYCTALQKLNLKPSLDNSMHILSGYSVLMSKLTCIILYYGAI